MVMTVMLGVIQAVDTASQVGTQLSGQDGLWASAELNMYRGAIAAALVVGLAFLSGLAVLKRGALSYCAAFMVGTAAVLELFWLGFVPAPSASLVVLMQGVFAASVIIFLSASIRLARHHAALGGVMFAASLVFVGVGIINFLGRADFSSVILRGLAGVSLFTFVLAAFQSLRGDSGARIVFPGAVLALAATGIFVTGAANPLIGHALLTLGLLVSSMVALTDKSGTIVHAPQRSPNTPLAAPVSAMSATPEFVGDATTVKQPAKKSSSQADEITMAEALPEGRKPAISGERLVEVLDYSGIGVWDWSVDGVYQSASLCAMLGADCEANFTPEAMRAFIMPSHLGVFEGEVLGHNIGDGGFDTQIVLHNGIAMRARGARAVDNAGRLERVVALFERATVTPGAAMVADDAMAGPAQVLAGATAMESLDNIKSQRSSAFHEDTKNSVSKEPGQRPNEEIAPSIDILSNPPKAIAVDFNVLPVQAFATQELIGFDFRVEPGAADWKSANWVKAVFAQACSFLFERQNESRTNPSSTPVASDAFVSFALSYADLSAKGVVDSICSALSQSGLPFGALALELSGLEAIGDVSAAKSRLSTLRQSGVRLAFADANAGRAVLGNIHRYDFDTIKIDGDLISRAKNDRTSQNSIRTLVSLGRDLGLRVIAEGVDDGDDHNRVSAMGCSFGRGAHFSETAPISLTAKGAPDDGIAYDHSASSDQPFAATANQPVPEFLHKHNNEVRETGSDNTAETVSSALSLDQWKSESSVSTMRNTEEAPIRNIEEAFAKSVPVFQPRLDTQARADENAGESALPKWRTWVNKMR